MAKNRKSDAAETTPQPTPKDGHKNPVVSLRPPPALREVVEKLARDQRRSLSQTILLLLEESLAAKNLWPPPAVDPDD